MTTKITMIEGSPVPKKNWLGGLNLEAIETPFIRDGIYCEKNQLVRVDAVPDLIRANGRQKETRELCARVIETLIKGETK